MDAQVQFLLHHLWPSPAAIRARLPHTPAPGFTAGQNLDASVFASCYSLQSCSPLDQVTPVLTSEAFTSELSPLQVTPK